MALTLDSMVAGFRMPRPIIKTGATMSAVGALRGYTPWYANGSPGAATANAVGVNGAAVVGPVSGMIPRENPSGGQSAYLARWSMQTNVTGSLWLIDRLWHNSGLVVTSTAGQAITSATLPARDIAGTKNGDGEIGRAHV